MTKWDSPKNLSTRLSYLKTRVRCWDREKSKTPYACYLTRPVSLPGFRLESAVIDNMEEAGIIEMIDNAHGAPIERSVIVPAVDGEHDLYFDYEIIASGTGRLNEATEDTLEDCVSLARHIKTLVPDSLVTIGYFRLPYLSWPMPMTESSQAHQLYFRSMADKIYRWRCVPYDMPGSADLWYNRVKECFFSKGYVVPLMSGLIIFAQDYSEACRHREQLLAIAKTEGIILFIPEAVYWSDQLPDLMPLLSWDGVRPESD